jgi:hypothetical protein
MGVYAMVACNWIAYYKCVLLVEDTNIVHRKPQSLRPHVTLQVTNIAPVADAGCDWCDYGIVNR